MSPIEFAIDEIRKKISELNEVAYMTRPDLKRLQLKLQGAVSAQVHAGPLAYAKAFLVEPFRFDAGKVEELKIQFRWVFCFIIKIYSVFQMFSIMLFIFRREFVNICDVALDVNQQWIGPNQLSYQQTMRDSFRSFVVSLSDILGETVRICVHSYNFSILRFLCCCCCCCCFSFSVTNSLV